jgi:signal transduction histidine kinase
MSTSRVSIAPDRTIWLAYLLLGSVGIVAYYLNTSNLGQALIYDGLNLSSVLAILVGLRWQRPHHRVPWALIAAGSAMSLAGNATWDIFELALHQEPFPSVADVFYLTQYPLLAAGLVLMVRSRTGGGDRADLLDSLIVTSGASALMWIFLVVPATRDTGGLEQVFASAYPLMDVVVVGVMVRLVVGPGRRSTSYVLLLSSLFSILAADAAFGVMAPLGLYETGSIVDVGWLVSFVTMGAAGLHASASLVGERQPARSGLSRRRRLALVLSAGLLGPGALVVQHVMARSSLLVILVGSGTIMVLVLVRIAEQQRTEDELRQALLDLHGLNRQREALLARLVNAQEEERRLIAYDIHDDSIQKIIAARMRLDIMQRYHPGLGTNEDFAKLTEGIERSISSLRHLMFELRPYTLDSAGLAHAVGLYLDEQGNLPGSPAFGLEGRLKTEPSEDVRVILYRIIQEAVTNARKHARAALVRVVLDEDERGHTVQIIDDGRGFDAARSSESAPGHLGLTAMRERAEMAGGWLGLESVPGEGATVTVWVPRWDPHVSGHEAPDRDYPRRETANGDGEEEGNQPEQPVPMPAQSRRAGEG